MNSIFKLIFPLLLLLLVVSGAWFLTEKTNVNLPSFPSPVEKKDELSKIVKFKSIQDFKNYLSKAPVSPGGVVTTFGRGAMIEDSLGAPAAPSPKAQEFAPTMDRYSQTNVQVRGIDEPDIVKTDGREIFVSSPNRYFLQSSVGVSRSEINPIETTPNRFFDPKIYPPPEPQGGVKAVKAFPPQSLKVDKTLDKSGEMLLKDNNLIIISDQYPRKIYSYNVQNPTSPVEKWVHELKDNNEIVTSRLYGDKIYLITRTNINPVNPCPIVPLMVQGRSFSIPCVDVFHPVTPVPADVTYSIFLINLNSGQVDKSVSFIGSSGQSVVYMSQEAIYLSYFYPGDFISYFVNFLNENKDLYPSEVSSRIAKLTAYDISSQAKMTELTQILEQYRASLGEDERLKLDNETQNRIEGYGKKHNRELGKTGIVKISANNLDLVSTGSIPGQPLNQFSFDEFQGNLRVATTVGGGWWGWGGWGSSQESANDVYVLDINLNILGNVKDLGVTERIYSARFIGNKGYLVTFRQTDPFYVLDLKNPRAPKMTGELKIPGFSSYLHPLKDDQILGVGQENGQVKLSLFDVSNPNNPQELAKYNLNDYWTEVSSNHHAFQHDPKHQIFFLPGGQGAYIFSYEGNNLRLIKALSQLQARRALYINDYLYVVGDQKITVLSENTWEKVKELDL